MPRWPTFLHWERLVKEGLLRASLLHTRGSVVTTRSTEDFGKTPLTQATLSGYHCLPDLTAVYNTVLTPVVLTKVPTDVNDSSTLWSYCPPQIEKWILLLLCGLPFLFPHPKDSGLSLGKQPSDSFMEQVPCHAQNHTSHLKYTFDTWGS